MDRNPNLFSTKIAFCAPQYSFKANLKNNNLGLGQTNLLSSSGSSTTVAFSAPTAMSIGVALFSTLCMQGSPGSATIIFHYPLSYCLISIHYHIAMISTIHYHIDISHYHIAMISIHHHIAIHYPLSYCHQHHSLIFHLTYLAQLPRMDHGDNFFTFFFYNFYNF